MTDEMFRQKITVWACPECEYWRSERGAGYHVIDENCDEHTLIPVIYVFARVEEQEVAA